MLRFWIAEIWDGGFLNIVPAATAAVALLAWIVLPPAYSRCHRVFVGGLWVLGGSVGMTLVAVCAAVETSWTRIAASSGAPGPVVDAWRAVLESDKAGIVLANALLGGAATLIAALPLLVLVVSYPKIRDLSQHGCDTVVPTVLTVVAPAMLWITAVGVLQCALRAKNAMGYIGCGDADWERSAKAEGWVSFETPSVVLFVLWFAMGIAPVVASILPGVRGAVHGPSRHSTVLAIGLLATGILAFASTFRMRSDVAARGPISAVSFLSYDPRNPHVPQLPDGAPHCSERWDEAVPLLWFDETNVLLDWRPVFLNDEHEDGRNDGHEVAGRSRSPFLREIEEARRRWQRHTAFTFQPLPMFLQVLAPSETPFSKIEPYLASAFAAGIPFGQILALSPQETLKTRTLGPVTLTRRMCLLPFTPDDSRSGFATWGEFARQTLTRCEERMRHVP